MSSLKVVEYAAAGPEHPSAARLPQVTSLAVEVGEETSISYPEGGTRAYLVVFGAFCSMFASFGVVNTLGTFQTYLSTHQLASYDEDVIAWIFSIYVFIAYFGGVQVGPLFDAQGPRRLIPVGVVCLVGGVVAMGQATKYWHFILAFSLVSGLGTCLLFTPAVGSVAHWFDRCRAAMSGIAYTGGSVGAIIFPLILPVSFDTLGWAWSVRLLALILAVLGMVAVLLVRGRNTEFQAPTKARPALHILRQKPVALMTIGVFFLEWGLFIPLVYISSWARAMGVGDSNFEYQLLAILNAGSLFGRWLPGYAADRFERLQMLIFGALMALISVLGLWLPGTIEYIPTRGNVPLAVLFALCFGFASGSGISLTPVCIGELCDVSEYGTYYATCYTICSFGCLTSLPIAGALIKANGGRYLALVIFTAVCYAVALLCFITVRALLQRERGKKEI